MQVLVTGAAGFVGRAVCQAITEAGQKVRAVTRSAPDFRLAADRIDTVGDFIEVDWAPLLQGIDAVVHLAGRAHAVDADEQVAERLYARANVDVLEALASAAVKERVGRLILVSSIKVNGEETFSIPFTAHDQPKPEDAYGRSKALAERRLKEIAADDMTWVILRPPLMYGRGAKGNLARLLAMAERGVPVPFGSINNARDLLSVNSFAQLVVSALCERAAANQTFLACDGTPISTPELFRIMASAKGRRAIVLPCPRPLLSIAGRLTGRTGEVRRLIGNLRIDDSPTRRLLKWSPAITTVEGLLEIAATD